MVIILEKYKQFNENLKIDLGPYENRIMVKPLGNSSNFQIHSQRSIHILRNIPL